MGLCGPNNVDWIKKVLGPIFLYLPKPFCQRIVFCGKAIFCGRFVFCCSSLSLAFLSLDLSYSLVFLVGLWALLFIGFPSSWAFRYKFAKMGINITRGPINSVDNNLIFLHMNHVWSSVRQLELDSNI